MLGNILDISLDLLGLFYANEKTNTSNLNGWIWEGALQNIILVKL